MISKTLLVVCIIGACSAVIIDTSENLFRDPYKIYETKGYHKISYHPPARSFNIYHDDFAYPKYEYQYAVSDKKTGDHKYHHEARDGHRVSGGYGLVEPDGSVRKVVYDADDHNGFRAVVSKSTHMHGDNAYSMMGHARHFSQFGNGVKINHYFPKKVTESNQEKTTTAKTLTETMADMVMAKENMEDVDEEKSEMTPTETESQNKSMENDALSQLDITMPTPTIKDQEEKKKEEIPVMQTTELMPEASPIDAEGASSFYHSRIYFLSY